ncbi:hypothetical protein BWD09_05380 [Neisseria dentiae]|uniref:Lipoprotein n=1 Tax=Neisseria dentiae TaxID=194197 RepID=A0A1X3DD48_9NEIS|nr:hypothetical protein [Neisseria dentiae]OSI17427.1 hypothetical protein BWD09_05380 [Neisseria dentiae]QMT45819.1 hypothetical protein H3L92_03140 [Neisseria dentiae]
MKHSKLLILSAALSVTFLSACEVSNHENSKVQQSTLKGKDNMQPQSPMLNEIFSSEKYIRPGQSKDVNHIVSKYLPIGSSKEEVINKLNEMNQNYKEEGNIIHAGYRKKTPPMTPQAGVRITLKFNNFSYLENIDSEFSYAQ